MVCVVHHLTRRYVPLIGVNLKVCHKLEIAGLLLLLLSFGWEFFATSFNDKIISSNYQRHIEKRLDEIHERQFLLQKNINAIAQQAANGTISGANYLHESKYHTSHQGDGGRLSEANEGYKKFRALVFILASALMIIGKILEYSSKKDT